MKAGSGKVEIVFSKNFFPVEGFTKIYDELYARAVYLKEEQEILFVSLELTSIPEQEAARLKELVSEQTGVAQEHIWISVTHTFSAPHIRPTEQLNKEEQKKNEILKKAIADAVCRAAKTAVEEQREAGLGSGCDTCDVNVNRDILTEEGWWIGSDPERFSDKDLSVFRINDNSGALLAVIYHYGVQSSVMDGSKMKDGGKIVTSDLAGRASKYIEKQFGAPVTALFLIGAAGDQAPRKKAVNTETGEDAGEKGLATLEELGQELGRRVVEITSHIEEAAAEVEIAVKTKEFMVPGQKMATEGIQNMRPVKTYFYEQDKERRVKIEAVRIGEQYLLGVSPELNAATASEIWNRLEAEVLVVTMVNGAAKYMADSGSYKRFTYEARNSFYGRGAAETLVDQAAELLESMK